ncbi:hypothetical protein C5167_038020 [Papaver somniferum]|uniref:Uncharacterized protein n=1 Tax=Papaver somniferum TaxID=3469 RepID=A0A4Y7IC54_PAPSO|nr:hypothetical protein C5167_038020 [Papaver somniferum]
MTSSSVVSIARGIFRNKVKWKRFRYTPHDTKADCFADKPNALNEGELKDLVKFWVSEEHRVLSDGNVEE